MERNTEHEREMERKTKPERDGKRENNRDEVKERA